MTECNYDTNTQDIYGYVRVAHFVKCGSCPARVRFLWRHTHDGRKTSFRRVCMSPIRARNEVICQRNALRA